MHVLLSINKNQNILQSAAARVLHVGWATKASSPVPRGEYIIHPHGDGIGGGGPEAEGFGTPPLE